MLILNADSISTNEVLFMMHLVIIERIPLRIPDSYGAKTTENQTPLSHFA